LRKFSAFKLKIFALGVRPKLKLKPHRHRRDGVRG
jgi:hypothetical protein